MAITHTSSTENLPSDVAVVVAKVKRTRKGGSRSKTGCITCRLRRVKCDEQRPVCLRCANSKRICEGFPSIFATSKPWEVIQDPYQGSMIKPSINPRVASNDHALQSFHFFEKKTVPILSEVFGKDLWSVALPRAALHCPIIWHAAVALGSAHEARTLIATVPGVVSQPKLDWTVEQYNRAIRALTNDTAAMKCRTDIAIVASVMFMVFEITRHEFAKALSHAKSGIGMYREYCRRMNSGTRIDLADDMIPLPQLERSLRQMEHQLCEVTLDQDGPITGTIISKFEQDIVAHHVTPESIRPSFVKFDDAREELRWHWASMMDKMYFVFEAGEDSSVLCPNALRSEQEYYQQAVTHWFRKFAAFLDATNLSLTSAQRAHYGRLENYGLLFLQMVGILSLDPSTYDDYAGCFEEILDHCQNWMSMPHGFGSGMMACLEKHRSLDSNCVFQTNSGLVAVVFHVFWRCRTAQTRQKALNLLGRYPRRAFLWDSPMVIDICNHIDEIERGPQMLHNAAKRRARPAEIPYWRRVRAIGLELNHAEQTSKLTYVTLSSATSDVEIGIERVIRWESKGVFG